MAWAMSEVSFIPNKQPDSFRILHTADWHLGKLLNDQSRDAEHERFLTWLLAVVKEHGVDAIILAGDVFDTANPPQSALGRYFDFVSGLFRQGDCALVVIAGNHDSAAQLEAPKQALHALNVHVVGFLAENPEARLLHLPDGKDPRVVIAMMPFLRDRDLRVGRAGESADDIRSQIVDGIRQRYSETAEAVKQAGTACPTIATGHLTVLGAKSSDSERDIHIGGLGAVTADTFPDTFAYVALGHLHRPQTTDGSGRVRYAGSPIALSFSEADDCKEVRVLDVTPQGVSQYGLPIPVFRRLAQIRTTNAGLETAMKEICATPAEFRTWVEVIVEDATLEDDLNERVRELAEGRGVEVLKVLLGRSAEGSGMSAENATDDEAIETLIDQPLHVFDHLLSNHSEFDETQIEALQTAFSVLVDLDSQSDLSPTP